MAALWLALLSSAPAQACALCFGGLAANNKGLWHGLFFSGVVLILCTFTILGALTATVYRIERNRHD